MSTRSGNPAKKAAAERARKEARDKAIADANDAVPSKKVKLVGKRGTRTIEVLPFMDWDADWRDYLPEDGMPHFAGWARAVLDDANLAKWNEAKPSNTHAMDFLNAYWEEQGEDLGESEDSQES